MFYAVHGRKIIKKLLCISMMMIIGISGFRFFLIPYVIYPIRFKSIIHQYAREYDLDYYLIYAVIFAESRFKPNAISYKGAKGLMQITDGTAKWAANEIGMKNFEIENIFEPEINIHIGCWYLNRLLTQYNQNYELTLAAYNAGSGNVAKWLQNDKYSSDGKTLYYIPFKETRGYIQKVIKHIEIYKKYHKK